jgi:hypothetical protein
MISQNTLIEISTFDANLNEILSVNLILEVRVPLFCIHEGGIL